MVVLGQPGRDVVHSRDPLRLVGDDGQGFAGGRGGSRSEAGVVDEGAGSVDQVVPQYLWAEDDAPLGRHCLGQRHRDDDVVETRELLADAWP